MKIGSFVDLDMEPGSLVRHEVMMAMSCVWYHLDVDCEMDSVCVIARHSVTCSSALIVHALTIQGFHSMVELLTKLVIE